MKKIPKITLIGNSMVGKTSFIYSLLKENLYNDLQDIVKKNNSGQTKVQVNYLFSNDNNIDGLFLKSIKFNDEKNEERKVKVEICKRLEINNAILDYDENNDESRNRQCEINIEKSITFEQYEQIVNDSNFAEVIKNVTFKVIPNEGFANVMKRFGYDEIVLSDCRGFLDETESMFDNYKKIRICNSDSAKDLKSDDSINQNEFAKYTLEERGLIDSDFIILMVESNGLKLTDTFQKYYGLIFEIFCKNENTMILARESRLTEAFDNNKIITIEDYKSLHKQENQKYIDCNYKYVSSFNVTNKTLSSIINNIDNDKILKYTIPEIPVMIDNKDIQYYKEVQNYLFEMMFEKIKEKESSSIEAKELLNDNEFKKEFNESIKEFIQSLKECDCFQPEYFGFSEELLYKINNVFTAGKDGLVGPRGGLTTWISNYGRVGLGAYTINKYCYDSIMRLIEIWEKNEDINFKKVAEAFKKALIEKSYYYSTFGARFMYTWDLEEILNNIKSRGNIIDCKEVIIDILYEFIKKLTEFIIENQQ